MGEVTVLYPGLFTTIQDKGRFGFSKYGIPKSGAMDQGSFRLANALLGNQEGCAVLEWALQPPRLLFFGPTIISITGADVDVYINNGLVDMNQQIRVLPGDVLIFGQCRNRMYGYIGIKNGFGTDQVYGSRSFYSGITNTHKLHKGDSIPYQEHRYFQDQYSSVSLRKNDTDSDIAYAFPGPEFNLLSEQQKKELFNISFTISNTRSRMAIQLQESFANQLNSMLTSPVLPGTVQLTPSGKMIILMRDCQTTGGYPRILQLRESSIDTISQKRTGEKIGFELTDFDALTI